MSFVAGLRARAAAAHRRVAFPECADARTQEAVRALARERIVEPVAILDPAHPETHGAVRALGVPVLDPAADPATARIAEALGARRAKHGVTPAEARELARDALNFADGLVALGAVDASVGGAVYTSAEVIRSALWSVGAATGVNTVSSAMYMVVPDFRGAGEEVLTFADCSVVPEPTAAQLAEIAIASARERAKIIGDAPRVALLSYSTAGSAEGASVTRMREALRILREKKVDFPVDGEMQGDTALIADVAARKMPASTVAGRANVLIFPSVDAGNLAYKLVQRLAHAQAIGPILQGLARPCSDLSRGASVDDIMNAAAIAALQATA
jgi:phosphate acetyltransferase